MILFPNCKINFGLSIVNRRPDGYHDIESLMLPVAAWTDILEIVPARGCQTTLTVTGNAVDCPPEKNLVMKAYRRLDEAYGPLPPVDIYLHKLIPDGAGLGGGSADAAFTLIGLNELLALDLTKEQLAEVAGKIGADCPFFIYNKPMAVSGTGTEMRHAAGTALLESMAIAIVKPPKSVSTKEAYAGVTPKAPGRFRQPYPADILECPELWREEVINDFEASVIPQVPEIGEIKEAMYSCGAVYAAMSGSGSAVYGLFPDVNVAERAAALFPDYPSCHGKLNDIHK